MVFTGNDKKKKVDPDKADADKPADADADKKADDDKPASDSATPAPDADAPKAEEKPAADEPGTIKEKPGGCGCRLADDGHDSGAGLAFAALAVSGVVLRRRKRAA
jgi:MYXO-CTERM domain-containing protein